MKAPDKIFIPDFEIEERAEFLVIECENDIPYIRKEAILEWAKCHKKETEDLIKEHPKDDSLWAEMHWYERLINHIESL